MSSGETTEALKPCPFCGSFGPYVSRHAHRYNDTVIWHYVGCDACDARGPSASEEEAAEEWNRREPAITPSTWQPIATAPRDGTVVLGHDRVPGQLAYRICYWGEAHWYDYFSEIVIRPTHWQPLPAPPAAPTDEVTP